MRWIALPLLMAGILMVISQRSENIARAARSVSGAPAADIESEIGRLFRHEIGKEMMLIGGFALVWARDAALAMWPFGALLAALGFGLWLSARHFIIRRRG